MIEKCPTCEAVLHLGNDLVSGEITECPECGEEIEITIDGKRVTLGLAPEVEEDWGE